MARKDSGLPIDGGPEVDGGPDPDAAPLNDGATPDGPTPDAACEGDRLGFRISNLDPCMVRPATLPLNLTLNGSYVINTDTGAVAPPSGPSFFLPENMLLPQAGGDLVRVTSVTSMSVGIGARVRVIGAPPLVVISRGDVLIGGVIDMHAAVSDPSSVVPAGYGLASVCGTRAGSEGKDSTDGASGGGGGGGGAYQGEGGGGGEGGGIARGARGVKGMRVTAGQLAPVPLRGGCPGGPGGAPDQASADATAIGGRGGVGGGALQISAGNLLTVAGTISVSGGGGGGGDIRTGGGGGGSGGAVLLEAKVEVRTPGVITANGGGGASGGGSTSALGRSGDDGHIDDGVAAGGGDCGGTSCAGGRGGNAGAGVVMDGLGASDGAFGTSGGGGGGGGGVGVIFLRAPSIPVMGMRHPPALTGGL